MLSKTLKKKAGEILEPIGKLIGKIGIKPNYITISSLFVTLYAAWFLYNQNIFYAFIIGLVACLLDGTDGLVARSTGTTSIRGGYLDAVIDRYVDCIAFSALILGGWMNPIQGLEFISGEVWAFVALAGAFQTSYSRAAAERLGVAQESIGIIERPERWFLLGMGLLIGELLGDVESIITWVIAFLAIFGNITVLQRMYHFWNEVKDD